MPTLSQVFGIRAGPVLSYTSRAAVDDKFQLALASDKHIVIYGSSKQGKTALRQKHLPKNKAVEIRCAPNSTTQSIYSSILRQINITLVSQQEHVRSKTGSTEVRTGFRAYMPLWSAGGDLSTTRNESSTESIESMHIGYDLADSQAISELLIKAQFKGYIVLENFHYLDAAAQRMLAFDLKTFHEVGIRFVILGVWQEANLLLTLNGDLQDRMVEIPVEPWQEKDFHELMNTGQQELNVEIGPLARNRFIEESYGNVGLLQEFLSAFCEQSGVKETAKRRVVLDDQAMVSAAINTKLDDLRNPLVTMLQSIAGRSRTDGDDPLILPYYLVRVLLTTSIPMLKTGIHRRDLRNTIRDMHHRKDGEVPRATDIANLLSRLPALQEGMQPPLLHYDKRQQRLKIIDTRQLFVLANADRNEILEEIPNPLDQDRI